MLVKTHKYRLIPNKAQRAALDQTLFLCRSLYNDALQERIGAYKLHQRVGRFDQDRQLPAIKEAVPEYKTVHSQVLQNVLKKLDVAYQNFFRRCKQGGAPGFPRFKGKDRYDSFVYNSAGWSLQGNQLSLSKIGNVKVRLSRPLPNDAVLKLCTIKREADGWYATITFEFEPVPLPSTGLPVGIDVGIASFATFSDGTVIPNPRIYQQAQAELRRAQRRVARRNKGSHRRRKAVVLLKKVHQRIANRRANFLHKLSTAVIQKYDAIAIEDLNVAGMSQGNLAKHVLDVSWAEWFRQLSYKAEWAGRMFVAVDPRYTSQTCAQCDHASKDNRKTQELFLCVSCGHTDHADRNAAVNILARAELSDANVAEGIACVV